MKNVPSEVVFQDPPFWTVTSWLQLGYGLWVNLCMVGIGLALGFPAVTVPQLLDTKDPFEPTLSDQAWLASVLTLTSPLGCLVSGYLQDHFGRRHVLIVCQIPLIIGWLIVGLSTTATVSFSLSGRVITGFGVGLALSAPRTYITEITLPNMRGAIGAFASVAMGLGITIQSVLGSILKWTTLCYICGVFSIILLLTYLMIPETPYYVLMKLTAADAKIVLRKFRSEKFDIDTEVDELADFKEVNNIHRLNFKEQMKEVFKTSTCKPFCIGMFYFTLMQIVGVNVITMWGVEMLRISNSSVNPNFGNVLISATRVMAGAGTSVILFKVSRRIMALLSAIGLGVACITLACWLFFNGRKSVYPLLLLIAYMFFASIGYYALPPLIMYELLPLQVRGLLGSTGLAYANILMFVCNWCYPYLREAIGFDFILLTFGVFSLLGSIVLFYILPETQGLTLQEIEEYYNETRPALVPSRQFSKFAVRSNTTRSGISTLQMLQRGEPTSSYENKKKLFDPSKSSIRFKDHDYDDDKDDDEDKKSLKSEKGIEIYKNKKDDDRDDDQDKKSLKSEKGIEIHKNKKDDDKDNGEDKKSLKSEKGIEINENKEDKK